MKTKLSDVLRGYSRIALPEPDPDRIALPEPDPDRSGISSSSYPVQPASTVCLPAHAASAVHQPTIGPIRLNDVWGGWQVYHLDGNTVEKFAAETKDSSKVKLVAARATNG